MIPLYVFIKKIFCSRPELTREAQNQKTGKGKKVAVIEGIQETHFSCKQPFLIKAPILGPS